METRQFTLKFMLWVMVFIYLITLAMPIQLLREGEQKIFISGFELIIPLGCLVFIIPILLLVYFSKRKAARVGNILLAILHLLFCLFTCLAAMVSFRGKPEPMGGCWLFVIVGIGVLVICVKLAKDPTKKRNASGLVDQLP